MEHIMQMIDIMQDMNDTISHLLDTNERLENRIDFLEGELIGLQATVKNIIKANHIDDNVIMREFPFDINAHIKGVK